MELYKFCSLDSWSIKNIYNSHIYFSNIEDLNDSGECLFYIEDNVKDSRSDLNKFIEEASRIILHHRPCLSDKFYHHLKVLKRNGRGVEVIATHIVAGMLKKYKTSSFTNVAGSSNPTMWGHYGNKSKGICLQYELDCDQDGTINYINNDEIENIQIKDISLSSIEDICKKILFKKSKDWQYEKEFRLLGMKNIVEVERSSLKCVYFGENVDIEDALFLKQIIEDKYEGVRSAVVYHRRFSNMMVKNFVSTKDQLRDVLIRKKEEDAYTDRYLSESAISEALSGKGKGIKFSTKKR